MNVDLELVKTGDLFSWPSSGSLYNVIGQRGKLPSYVDPGEGEKLMVRRTTERACAGRRSTTRMIIQM